MIEEIWKPIKGYEGYYEVSNMGRVRSVERKVYISGGTAAGKYRTVPSIIRKPNIMKGYYCIALIIDNHCKVFRIHRLVAEAFISEQPTPEHQINHKDGNKANNCVDNLEWVTPAQNTHHAYEHGLIKPWTDERRKRTGEKSKQYWQREEYRLAQSQIAKEKWSDPEHHRSRSKAIAEGIHAAKQRRLAASGQIKIEME